MAERVRVKGWMNPGLKRLDDFLLPDKRTIEQAVVDADIVFRQDRARTFATEGAAGSGKWAPLSERYRAYKRKIRPGRKILVFDGNLRSSLTRKSSSQHIARGFSDGQNWRLIWGTANPMAAYHGPTLLHNVRLPIRDAMGFSRRQAFRMLGSVYKTLLKNVKTRGIRALSQARARFEGG